MFTACINTFFNAVVVEGLQWWKVVGGGGGSTEVRGGGESSEVRGVGGSSVVGDGEWSSELLVVRS